MRTADGVTDLADNKSLGGLQNTAGGFQTTTVDLSQFAGQEIQVEFVFRSDTTIERTETISTTVDAGSTAFLVLGPHGSTLSNYALDIELPTAPDHFEPNDDFATATDLESIDLYSAENLSIHLVDDDNEDFSLHAARHRNVDISVLFSDADGDIGCSCTAGPGELVASARLGQRRQAIRARSPQDKPAICD